MKYILEFYVDGELDTVRESNDKIPLYPSKSDLVDIGEGLHRVQEVHLVYPFDGTVKIKVFLEKV